LSSIPLISNTIANNRNNKKLSLHHLTNTTNIIERAELAHRNAQKLDRSLIRARVGNNTNNNNDMLDNLDNPNNNNHNNIMKNGTRILSQSEKATMEQEQRRVRRLVRLQQVREQEKEDAAFRRELFHQQRQLAAKQVATDLYQDWEANRDTIIASLEERRLEALASLRNRSNIKSTHTSNTHVPSKKSPNVNNNNDNGKLVHNKRNNIISSTNNGNNGVTTTRLLNNNNNSGKMDYHPTLLHSRNNSHTFIKQPPPPHNNGDGEFEEQQHNTNSNDDDNYDDYDDEDEVEARDELEYRLKKTLQDLFELDMNNLRSSYRGDQQNNTTTATTITSRNKDLTHQKKKTSSSPPVIVEMTPVGNDSDMFILGPNGFELANSNELLLYDSNNPGIESKHRHAWYSMTEENVLDESSEESVMFVGPSTTTTPATTRTTHRHSTPYHQPYDNDYEAQEQVDEDEALQEEMALDEIRQLLSSAGQQVSSAKQEMSGLFSDSYSSPIKLSSAAAPSSLLKHNNNNNRLLSSSILTADHDHAQQSFPPLTTSPTTTTTATPTTTRRGKEVFVIPSSNNKNITHDQQQQTYLPTNMNLVPPEKQDLVKRLMEKHRPKLSREEYLERTERLYKKLPEFTSLQEKMKSYEQAEERRQIIRNYNRLLMMPHRYHVEQQLLPSSSTRTILSRNDNSQGLRSSSYS
jgi:hypothetical protein